MSDEERCCRLLIEFVKGLSIDQAEKTTPLVVRLEEELRRHLERGPLRLPSGGAQEHTRGGSTK
jgi:hypothetical protein